MSLRLSFFRAYHTRLVYQIQNGVHGATRHKLNTALSR